VHSLDLEQSELVDLLAMVRERVEPRVTRQGLRFKWQVDEVNCSAPLDPEAAGHILRIVQEALTNIIKHARAQTITLSTGVDDHKRYVAIEDDGVGVGSQDTVIGRRGEGRGMHNMHKRAEQLGGSLLVTDGVEGGTRVTLWLPG
jgi:signal transduction histidine kinase